LLNRRIPICGVMGDSQASLFAHRCFGPGDAKVTLGTGSSVLLNIGERPLDGGDAAVTTVAWTHRGAATYSFEGIINYSAATIAWLKDQLGLISSAEESEAAALAAGDNGGVYLVPAFAGLSAPHWSSRARAAIVGMTAHSNRNHVVRAGLESIGYQLRDVLDMMRTRGGLDLSMIHADGGATNNKFLMQFIADLCGLEVRVSEMTACSPLGAAMAGAVGMGARTIDELAKMPRVVTRYHPRMAAADAEALHDGWKRAVKQVLAGVE
jgi:glycerol kinase